MAFFKFRKGADAKAATSNTPAESIEVMRRRAKHRLLGTAVLVLVAVVGFPILFETQPRPVAVDIPIDIPDKNKVKPVGSAPGVPALASGPLEVQASKPAPVAAAGAVTSAPAAPKAPALSASAAVPALAASAVPASASLSGKEELLPAKAPAQAASVAKPAKPDDGAKAKALLEGKPVEAAEGAARFVVQVGAFADADKAREARLKLERAGLKTYAQVVETKDGKRTRVRLGPFSTRAQAEEAAAKAKAADLPAAILTL